MVPALTDDTVSVFPEMEAVIVGAVGTVAATREADGTV